MHDYAYKHFYQGVYVPNEAVDPEQEQKQELKEFIRERCPKTMRQEPSQTVVAPDIVAKSTREDEKINNYVDP